MKSAATAGDTAVADTVTVVATLDGWLSVAVTVLLTPFSATDTCDRCSVTVGAASLSLIDSVTLEGAVTPWLLTADADTVTVLCGASTLLSTAVIVTDPVLSVAPAAIVKAVPFSVKSAATAGDTAVADTVTVVATLDGWLSVAVTVLLPLFSVIESGVRISVTAGATSSSMIVNAALDGFSMPWLLTTTADTVTVLSGASTLLSAAVIVTDPVLSVAFAAKLRVVFELSVKSSAAALAPGAADTVTVNGALDAELTVAVTVLLPPFSEIESGVRISVTVGGVTLATSEPLIAIRGTLPSESSFQWI